MKGNTVFRNAYEGVRDFFEFDVPDFFYRVNVLRRMRDAEADADYAFGEMVSLRCMLTYGAIDCNRLTTALDNIRSSVDSTAAPNGTLRKIRRIANEAIEFDGNVLDLPTEQVVGA